MGHLPLPKRGNGAFSQTMGLWPLQIAINGALESPYKTLTYIYKHVLVKMCKIFGPPPILEGVHTI